MIRVILRMVTLVGVAPLLGCGPSGPAEPTEQTEQVEPLHLVVSATATGRLSGDMVRHACLVRIEVSAQGGNGSNGITVFNAALPTHGQVIHAWGSVLVTPTSPWVVTAVADPAVGGESIEYVVNFLDPGSQQAGQIGGVVECVSDYARVTDTVEVVTAVKDTVSDGFGGSWVAFRHTFDRPTDASTAWIVSCESKAEWPGPGEGAWSSGQVRNDTVTAGEPIIGIHREGGACWTFVWDWVGDRYVHVGDPLFMAASQAPLMHMRVVRSYWSR